ncbi:MAG TPA: single-stranded-DNA-specific exonuclease RecJ [Wenzhouxiangella sp.]
MGSMTVDRVLEALWRARGLDQAPDYALSRLLPPTLQGLDVAVARLEQALRRQESILVVGDFDADGATATVLAVTALKAMGAAHVDWKIPDRFRHGYGLSERLVDELSLPLPDLLVTVDQGVGSLAGVALAKSRGIDVIVTDHHLPGLSLPVADAIINPNLEGDGFPSKHLAGVGVVFYLMVALRQHLRAAGYFKQIAEPRLDQWLDLVALGTVADLVVLDDNNRRLVSQGLHRIRRGQTRPGIRALLEVAKRNLKYVDAADLGFAVGPRLNAAGRLEDMSLGVRCLLATSESQAADLAAQLDAINVKRRELQAEMQAQAMEQADRLMEHLEGDLPGACLFDPSWHQGLVGLVAGRVAERIQRPVVAFAPEEDGNEWLKGSARSPAGIHMRDLLVEIDTAHPGLIERFGGHSGAAGLTIAGDRFEAFETAFRQMVAKIPTSEEVIRSDGELPSDVLSVDLAESIGMSGPWGQGFSEPLFDGQFLVLERRIVGTEHLKLQLQPAGGGPVLDAIAFRAARLFRETLPQPWHVTYRLEVNRWRGDIRLQLNIQHWVVEVLDSA